MEVRDRNVLSLICKHIDDSVTWCRFSEASKLCHEICEALLVRETLTSIHFHSREHRTTLPYGVLHGEVIGEHARSGKEDCWYFWYSKTYMSGKLQGYYTVDNYRRYFNDGCEDEEERFLSSWKSICVLCSLQREKTYTNKYLSWEDFEAKTKDRCNYSHKILTEEH